MCGATGNVGRPLVERLLAEGHRVRALTRDPARAGLPVGAEVARGDLTDTASLVEVFAGVTAAHLIGFGGDHAPLRNGPELVALATKAGVRKVTVLKGEAETTGLDRAVAAADWDHTFLSPVEFMSNSLEWATQIRETGQIVDGFADVKSAMVHEADIASVAATVLTTDGHAGKEYWLTGPEALTARDRLAAIAAVLGRDIPFVELGRDEIVARWRAQGHGDEDIEFFLAMRTTPPEVAYTPLPTVEQVTGHPPRTYDQWVRAHETLFSPEA
ncbi:NAD(P)H-binding protein [Saccharothrix violaceirubra]